MATPAVVAATELSTLSTERAPPRAADSPNEPMNENASSTSRPLDRASTRARCSRWSK